MIRLEREKIELVRALHEQPERSLEQLLEGVDRDGTGTEFEVVLDAAAEAGCASTTGDGPIGPEASAHPICELWHPASR